MPLSLEEIDQRDWLDDEQHSVVSCIELLLPYRST